MLKLRAVEYQRIASFDDAGMGTTQLVKKTEFYGLLVPTKEALEVKAFGETKNITHRFYSRFYAPTVGNVLEVQGNKYLVLAVRKGMGNAMSEADLEWLQE